MADITDTNADMDFTWSDVWLLQAVAMAARKKPASLSDIVARGDAIQHAIFTFEELSCGLRKLIAARLVVFEGDRFQIVPSFVPIYVRLEKRARSWTGNNDAVARFLKSISPHAIDSSSNPSHFDLKLENYDEAVRRYVGKL